MSYLPAIVSEVSLFFELKFFASSFLGTVQLLTRILKEDAKIVDRIINLNDSVNCKKDRKQLHHLFSKFLHFAFTERKLL